MKFKYILGTACAGVVLLGLISLVGRVGAFAIVAAIFALVGMGIGWILRGRGLLTLGLCAAAGVLGQAISLVCFGPELTPFTLHNLIGYFISMSGPFICFYLVPCLAVGAATRFVANMGKTVNRPRQGVIQT